MQISRLFLLVMVSMTVLPLAAQNDMKMEKKLRHVVLFKFKDSATDEDVASVEKAFAALPDKISEIQSFEWGINNSPEGLNQGLTHAFLLTFSSEADRDAYLIHPDHQVFGKMVGNHLDKVTVVDYWTDQ